MKRIICLLLLLVLFATTSLCVMAEDTKKLKIGVIAPITGRIASVGESLKNSMAMASEGNTAVDFIIEDDQFVPKNSVSAALKLMLSDKVDALIIFGSGPTLAVLGQPQAKKIPIIALATANTVIEKGPLVYRWAPSVTEQNKVIIEELKKRNYASFGMVTAPIEATMAVQEEFNRVSPFKPKLSVEASMEDDMRIPALKIKQSKLDAVFMLLLPPQYANLSQRLKEIDYKGELFSSIFLQNPDEIKASNGALNGARFAGIDDTKAVTFKAEYVRRFKSTPFPDGTIAYDLTKTIIKAATVDILLKTLSESSQIEGEFGVFKKTSERTFCPPLAIKMIRDGRVG